MWPIIAVITASMLFATTGTAQGLAAVNASGLAVGSARMVMGGGALGLIALLAARSDGAKHMASAPSRSRRFTRTAFVATLWLSIGALGAAAYQPFFFTGTRANGVAVGTVITLGTAAILTGLLEAAWRRNMPSPRWIVATAFALVGVVLISGVATTGGQVLRPAALSASAGAGASYALYTVSAKRLIEQEWGSTRAMGAIFGLAAVMSMPLLAWSGTDWLLTARGLMLVTWLGLFTVAVAYVMFGWGLARLNSSTVVTLSLVEPLGATLLGVFLLHEQLTPTAIGGMVVIATGLIILTLPERTVTNPTP